MWRDVAFERSNFGVSLLIELRSVESSIPRGAKALPTSAPRGTDRMVAVAHPAKELLFEEEAF